jgi:plastocyanin domain-containing protein
MNTRFIAGSIVAASLLVAIGILLSGPAPVALDPEVEVVTIEDGVQYVNVAARAGYSPSRITAAAGMPTVLRMHTQQTYDCSIALVIPKLNYSSYLQPTNIEEITIAPEQASGTLEGLCSMGMYRFNIVFE